jgi:hypothetical protein
MSIGELDEYLAGVGGIRRSADKPLPVKETGAGLPSLTRFRQALVFGLPKGTVNSARSSMPRDPLEPSSGKKERRKSTPARVDIDAAVAKPVKVVHAWQAFKSADR